MASTSRVHNALNRAYKKAEHVPIDLEQSPWVFFSDHHRGVRDEADDFQRCEKSYLAALQYYEESGYNLGLLGDVEELWENSAREVIQQYPKVLKAEKKFHERNALVRIWGNHDDYWREKPIFQAYFSKLFPKMKVHEALVLECRTRGEHLGNVVLLHGHQGSLSSERFATISRFFVRYFWRWFQKVSGFKLSTPAKNLQLKSKTDLEMYHWMVQKPKHVLLCGHTHQPVFMSDTFIDRIKAELKKDISDDERVKWEMELAKHADQQTPLNSGGGFLPCYFNTGCCSFSDGDITGIEIFQGKIRLVKWTSFSVQAKVLLERDIESVFRQCTGKSNP